jgi:hypothetical protein
MSRNSRRLLDETFSVTNAADSIFHHLAAHGLLPAQTDTEAPAPENVTATHAQHQEFAAKA